MRASVATVASAAIPLAALLSLTACRGVVAAAQPSATATTAALATSTTLTVTGPRGGIASVSGVPANAVTITSTGGTVTIDRTGEDGRTLDATLTWTCP
jgi:hypothetical protein